MAQRDAKRDRECSPLLNAEAADLARLRPDLPACQPAEIRKAEKTWSSGTSAGSRRTCLLARIALAREGKKRRAKGLSLRRSVQRCAEDAGESASVAVLEGGRRRVDARGRTSS